MSPTVELERRGVLPSACGRFVASTGRRLAWGITLWILAGGVSIARAANVVAEHGCVIFIGDEGWRTTLTEGSADAEPALSPDGRQVVFVRNTPGRAIETGAGEFPATELWTITVKDRKAQRWLEGHSDPGMSRVLAGMSSPRFSRDGTSIYFLSEAWTTSGALHRLDLATGQERFIAAANSLEIVASGTHAGCLIVSQHRYHRGGGSDEDYWLIKDDGTIIRRVGDDAALVAFRAGRR